MNHTHWSNYWQSGVQTSLPQDFKDNYDGEIYYLWEQVVSRLNSGARVVDACTGNGAVALILADIALKQQKQLIITAVDISEINTQYIKENNPKEQIAMINFKSHCPIERLADLINDQQDAIVSQFGLEYSDLTQSAVALHNLMKENGELSFIAHSPKSAVFTYMDLESRIYTWLDEIGLFAIIKKFIAGQVSANGLKNGIVSVIENNKPDTSYLGHGLFQSWQKTMFMLIKQPNQQLKQQKQSLSLFVTQHQAAQKRLQDMLNVAMKVSKNNWYQPFVDCGFELEESNDVLYKNQHHIGRYYRFRSMVLEKP